MRQVCSIVHDALMTFWKKSGDSDLPEKDVINLSLKFPDLPEKDVINLSLKFPHPRSTNDVRFLARLGMTAMHAIDYKLDLMFNAFILNFKLLLYFNMHF